MHGKGDGLFRDKSEMSADSRQMRNRDFQSEKAVGGQILRVGSCRYDPSRVRRAWDMTIGLQEGLNPEAWGMQKGETVRWLARGKGLCPLGRRLLLACSAGRIWEESQNFPQCAGAGLGPRDI